MRTKNWLTIGGMGGIVVGCALLTGAAEGPKQIGCTDIQSNKIVLMGKLGPKLGTYMTLDVAMDDKPTMETQYVVNKVDGNKLEKPILVKINSKQPMSSGTRYILRGYETGAMVSVPVDPAIKSDKESGQQQFYHFACWFQVTQVKSATPAPQNEHKD